MQVSSISSVVHRIHESKAPSGVRKTFQKWMSLFMNDLKPSNSRILTVKGLVFRINIKVCPSFCESELPNLTEKCSLHVFDLSVRVR